MNIASIINEFITNHKYDRLTKISECDDLECDGDCNKLFKDIVKEGTELYKFKYLLICGLCLHKNSMANGLKYIDKRDYSEEWLCLYCEEKQGGGCGRYCNNDFLDDDICKKCYPIMSQYYKKLGNVGKYCIVFAGWQPYCFKMSKVKILDIPEQLKDNINENVIKEWLESFDAIASIDEKIVKINEWIPFTNVYDIPHFPARTQLLVNCSKKRNGQIASIVRDDHGRMAIDIIYDNMKEYLKDYEKWKENRLSKEDQQSMSDQVAKDFKETWTAEEDDMASICDEFSGYIRLTKKLKMYYG
uniref:Uncharacterized protein n=1 Tax=Marseillevirus LCMAC102 TaxID=2506603 RepID=A0A481YU45_9VIRU|nr:MAG: hypothetical protein LCMAC102_02620 [Marseillevirus LCMAC102]